MVTVVDGTRCILVQTMAGDLVRPTESGERLNPSQRGCGVQHYETNWLLRCVCCN